jgi:hypothetical protein
VKVARCLLVGTLTCVLVGCNGGTVDRHALTNDAASLDSIACEGALLARNEKRGATTATFVRIHAGALEMQSSQLADALASRTTVASIEGKVRAKSRDATQVANQLRRLRDHSDDRLVAGSVADNLSQLGSCP